MPELPKLVAQIIIQNPEKLDMRYWHSQCGTVHCLAGWAATIHPQGKELDMLFGTPAAGKILFPGATPYFYNRSNEKVMEFLKTIAQ